MAIRNWQDWKAQESAVLVFLRDKDNLLLIHKKRGLGAGKVNGPGGRIEAGEGPLEAALRETREETGLRVRDLDLRGILRFQFVSGYSLAAHLFLGEGYSGNLTPCEEADPFWQPQQELPWDTMWADDALWLPPLLAGKLVFGSFVFDLDKMLEANVRTMARSTTTLSRLTTEAYGL